MKQTTAYLDQVKQRHRLVSDYALAKYLRVGQPTVTRYRKRHAAMDDYTATRVAEALSINPMEVIAAAQAERAERAQDEEKKAFWEGWWKRVSGTAASVFLAVVLLAPTMNIGDICILC